MIVDAFNEPNLAVPPPSSTAVLGFPPEACFVLGARRPGRDGLAGGCGGEL